MDKIKSKPGLLNHYASRPPEVRWYFEHLPKLVSEFPLDVALAYVFAQVELAHNMALYCGVAKLHSADTDVARRAVNAHHMTRDDFRAKFETVFGKPIPSATSELLVKAEAARDRVMHGKEATDDQKRNAIAQVLTYAAELNDLINSLGGPKPFGDLRGFKGRGQPLPKSTSRWLLKGMGFNIR